MKQTIEKTWDLLENTVKQIRKKNSGVILDSGSYEKFDDIFRKIYSEIKERYMENTTQNLDRHKIASIIIISIINSNAIVYQGKVGEGEEFFGQYLIAASVGITFMQNQLNMLLIEKNKKPIEKLWFPDALSCDTPYFEIFCRNLYFSNNNDDWGINPLDIAERLFILEYVTIEKCGVDPHIFKEATHNKCKDVCIDKTYRM
jgi:hypothetical protein